MRQPFVLDAPSNLGLRPPAPGAVPGVYKLPGALRDVGFVHAIDAVDAGVVTPPRYIATWQPGDGARNGDAIARYSLTLADRVSHLLQEEGFAIVLGGDCSILIGNVLALRRRGDYGLAFLDGHSDFRHPGNADAIGAVAGEDLAVVTGRGDDRLVNLEGRGPYLHEQHVVAIGMRSGDAYLSEMRGLGILTYTTGDLARHGVDAVVGNSLERLTAPSLEGFWIHLDVDILDPSVMPAVDTPDPGGIDLPDLTRLLSGLIASEAAVGLEICVFDPDLDTDGRLARELNECLVEAIRSGLGLGH